MSKEEDFFKLQYESLRQEIKESKSRAFQILTIGFTVLPAAQALGIRLEANAFIIVVPALIITFALLFLAENHAIMRCGRFIRTKIEQNVSTIPGWETHLEEQRYNNGAIDNTRTVDRYTIYAFFIMFLAYYFLSTLLALLWILDIGGSINTVAAFSTFYIAIGALFGIYLNKNLLKATSTTTELRSKTILEATFGQRHGDTTL